MFEHVVSVGYGCHQTRQHLVICVSGYFFCYIDLISRLLVLVLGMNIIISLLFCGIYGFCLVVVIVVVFMFQWCCQCLHLSPNASSSAGGWMDGRTDRQTGRQTGRQADRQRSNSNVILRKLRRIAERNEELDDNERDIQKIIH